MSTILTCRVVVVVPGERKSATRVRRFGARVHFPIYDGAKISGESCQAAAAH